MGDKSPKSKQKSQTQKQSKKNASNNVKQSMISAKQQEAPKPGKKK
jgi:hypothetical protein